MGIRSTQDLTILAPGVVFNEGIAEAQVHVRGFGTTFSNAGLESPFATYIDGVPMQTPIGLGNAGVLDVSSIQILEGPQGSLYGRNATVGAMIVTTQNPTNKTEGYVAAEYGNLKHYQLTGLINTPLTDTLAIRVLAQTDHEGGYVTNLAGGNKLGDATSTTVRGKIKWSPSSAVDVILGSEYYNAKHTASSIYAITGGAPACLACAFFGQPGIPLSQFYTTNQDFHDPGTDDSSLTTLNIRANLASGLTLTSVTGHRLSHFYLSADFDGSALSLFNYRYTGSFNQTSEDVQLASAFDGPLDFTTGVFYLHDRDTVKARLSGGLFGPLVPGEDSVVNTDSASIFAEAYYKIVPDLTLTVGGRYNYDGKSQVNVNNPDGVLAFAGPGNALNSADNSFTPRVVLNYKTSIGTFYVKRDTGVKSGGFTSPAFSPQPIVQPEKVTSYEIGAKLKALDGRLRFDIAGFYETIKDKQVAVTRLPEGLVVQNAATAKSYGLDASANFAATDKFTFGFGGAYVHARYDSYPGATFYVPDTVTGAGYVATTKDLAGSPLEAAPNFSGTASAAYKFGFGKGWSGSLSTVGRYTTKYFFFPGGSSPDQFATQNEFFLLNVNGSISPPDAKVKLGFYVRNATNVKYDDTRPQQTIVRHRAPALPRTFGVNARYDF